MSRELLNIASIHWWLERKYSLLVGIDIFPQCTDIEFHLRYFPSEELFRH